MAVWSVQFSPEATIELQHAIEYYEQLVDGLGFEFKDEFEKQIRQISVNPFTRAIRYLNVRFAVVERFPYAIHYIIKENTKTIVIQTVLSTFRNPDEYWKKR
jgi:hypothetical protein